MMDTKSLLNLTITTTFNSFCTERRFASDLPVGQLKNLLEGLTGASPSTMRLQLINKEGTSLGFLPSDDATLTAAGAESGMSIQVSDPTVRVGEYEDLSKVKKFELSDEAYAKRGESLRAFKERNKLGQFNTEAQDRIAEQNAKKEAVEADLVEKISIGDRCLVQVPSQPSKRGQVMFKGTTSFKPGYWVGIKYDEPLGKNDGSVDGKRYFECPQKYGAFVRPESVTIGDYPEETFDLDAEM